MMHEEHMTMRFHFGEDSGVSGVDDSALVIRRESESIDYVYSVRGCTAYTSE